MLLTIISRTDHETMEKKYNFTTIELLLIELRFINFLEMNVPISPYIFLKKTPKYESNFHVSNFSMC
jgi:hypothetical protein